MSDKVSISNGPKAAAASLVIRAGDRFLLEAEISDRGLALLGGLVTAILLSTSVIILAARLNWDAVSNTLPASPQG